MALCDQPCPLLVINEQLPSVAYIVPAGMLAALNVSSSSRPDPWISVSSRLRSSYHHRDGSISGLLQVRNPFTGGWGTVCGDGFGTHEVAVACRTLGYAHGYIVEYNALSYRSSASDALPVMLDGLACTGTEEDLRTCEVEGWAQTSCAHEQDVVIRCSGACRPDITQSHS